MIIDKCTGGLKQLSVQAISFFVWIFQLLYAHNVPREPSDASVNGNEPRIHCNLGAIGENEIGRKKKSIYLFYNILIQST